MQAVVVHRGSRDHYQLAAALAEAGLLQRLITDFYWSGEGWLARGLERAAGHRVARTLRGRHESLVPAANVKLCWLTGVVSQALSRVSMLPFSWRQRAVRQADHDLGRVAGRVASRTNSALVSYSYYGHSAFSHCRSAGPKILFQLHPHPNSVRRILRAEWTRFPECESSLRKEWELSLPAEDYRRLVAETQMADYWIAASTFTRQTLVENGIPSERILVAPYGVDCDQFRPAASGHPDRQGPLRLLFVGTINQRKGIKYLLDAVRMLDPGDVELTVCGRVVDDLPLFRDCPANIRVRPSVSAGELLNAYQSADLFVFPSLAEGFAHVLLESLACGLPIVSTERTAAPDLIRHGEQGFLVSAGSATAIAQQIDEVLRNRTRLSQMRIAARRTAESFSWVRFRRQTAQFVREVCERPATMAAGSHV